MFRLGFWCAYWSFQLGKLERLRVFVCERCTIDHTNRKPEERRKKKRNGKCKNRRLFNTETKRWRRTSMATVIKKRRNTLNSVRKHLYASALVLVFGGLHANSTTFEIVGICVCVWSLVIRFEWDNQIFGIFFSFLFINFVSTLFSYSPRFLYITQLTTQMK